MFELILPWLFSEPFLANPANVAYLVYDENDPYPQPMHAWRAQYKALQQYTGLSSVCAIQVPVLLLAGEQDWLAHLEDAERLEAAIQHATLAIIPDSGHLINYEQPDLFHEHMLNFLSH